MPNKADADSNRPQKRARPWSAGLILGLGLLIILLIVQIRLQPPLNRYGVGFSEPDQQVLIYTDTLLPGDVRVFPLRLDLESGELKPPDQRPAPQRTGTAQFVLPHAQRVEAVYRDSNGQLQRERVLIPSRSNGSLISERYVVAFDNERCELICHDLHHIEQGYVNEKRNGANSGWVTPLGNASRTFMLKEWFSNGTDACTLFRIENRSLKVIKAWPATPNNQVSTLFFEGEIYRADCAQRMISRHSIEDGTELGQIEFPSEVTAEEIKGGTQIRLARGCFVVSRPPVPDADTRIYTLPSLKQMSTRRSHSPTVLDVEKPWLLVVDVTSNPPTRILGWNRMTDEAAWEIEFSVEPTLFENVGDQILLGYPKAGYTFDLIDPSTGNLIRRLQPFAMTVWLLPALCIGFFFWTGAVALAPIASPLQKIPIVAIVLLIAMLAYLAYWRLIPGYPAVPLFNTCHGLFLGLANAACIWLVFGRTRISLRYLPLLGVISLQLFICILVFFSPRFASEALVSTLVPALMAGIPMIAIRLTGCRFQLGSTNDSGTGTDSARSATAMEASHSKRLSIRDLLLASLGFAVFVACLKPALDFFQIPALDSRIIIGTGIWMLLTTIFLVGVQSRKRGLRLLTVCAAVTIFAAVMFESLHNFTTGQNLGRPRMDRILVITRVLAAAALTQYFVQFIYASHGWRLTRGKTTPDQRIETPQLDYLA
ncbi:MAG: hypothetical protein ACE361_03665 [Aureliella sp.]